MQGTSFHWQYDNLTTYRIILTMSLVENDLKTESDQSEGVKTSGFIVYGTTTVL